MKKMETLLLKTRSLTVIGCLAGLLLLVGCLDDNDNPEPIEVALVGIYHASPDANGLDIIVGTTGPINSEPLVYRDYTGYLNFYPGDRKVKFTVAQNTAAALVDTTLTFLANRYYSVFITDSLSSIEALVFGDSASTPGTGKTMLRVIHLSPDAPTVSVSLDGNTEFTDISFREGSAFKEVDSGTIDFEFTTVNGASESEVLLTVPQIEIKSGQYLTLVLNGFTHPPAGNTHELSTDIIRH